MLRKILNLKTSHFYKPFTTLSYIPHAFDMKESAQKFVNAEQKRIFAPNQNAEAIIKFDSVNPLKKVLFPMFGINARVGYTKYRACYSVERIESESETDSRGNRTTNYRTYTDWYYVSGTLEACSYKQDDFVNMRIYAGYNWDPKTVENTFENEKISDKLLTYNSDAILKDTYIDPFIMRLGRGLEVTKERIGSYEINRIKADVKYNAPFWHFVSSVIVNSYYVHYTDIKLTSCMLPGYVLQYPNSLPRFLSAIDYNSDNVYGYTPVSIAKVMSAASVGAALFTILFPGISMSARLIMMAGSSLFSGIWAAKRGDYTAYSHEHNIKMQQHYNEGISETLADQKRFEETSRDFKTIEPDTINIPIDSKLLARLGLDPQTEITYQVVQKAFSDLIKKQHPDAGGNAEKANDLIEARKEILNKLAESKGESKRHYSTYRQVKLKEPPRSVRDPNAIVLISLVLDLKDYKRALKLVKDGEVHPDGHDAGENTLLTEAAKRGDLNAIKFAINELKVSPDTSCDCPLHNTALHYAASTGNIKAVKLLIELGSTVNLINSKGQTALDMAKMENHHEVISLLISHGALPHSTQQGKEGLLVRAHGFFGYPPSDRTMLIENYSNPLQANKNNGVIYLPAPKR